MALSHLLQVGLNLQAIEMMQGGRGEYECANGLEGLTSDPTAQQLNIAGDGKMRDLG